MENLGCIIKAQNVNIPGVTTRFLYGGLQETFQVWHKDDWDTPSVNELLGGAGKVW